MEKERWSKDGDKIWQGGGVMEQKEERGQTEIRVREGGEMSWKD